MDFAEQQGCLMITPSAFNGKCLQMDEQGLLTTVETDDQTLVTKQTEFFRQLYLYANNKCFFLDYESWHHW